MDMSWRRSFLYFTPKLIGKGFNPTNLIALLILCLGLTACGRTPEESWQPENDGLLAAAISRDGQQVLISNDKGQANLWQLEANGKAELLHQWAHAKQAEGGISVVALSANGQYALTADEQSVVWWRVKDGTIAGIWQLPEVFSIAISEDGKKALFGLRHGVQYFDLVRSKLIHRLSHPDRVRTVDISADGRFAISGSDDATAKAWDLKSGEMIHEWKYRSKLEVVRLSPDVETALVNPALNHIYLYSMNDGKERHSLATRNTTLADGRFSVEGKEIVTIQMSRRLDRWQVKSGKHLGKSMPKKPLTKADHRTVLSLEVIQDESKPHLLVVYSDGMIEKLSLP